MQRWQHGLEIVSAVILALVAGLTVAAPGMAAPATSEAVLAESDDVRALVAPVALYPDPILAVVLQASTLPLQVVQADRFLTKREKDKSLAPDPDWDKSIIALLNYPRQVRLMSEYIDWTEELGDRVVDDLGAVQAAVQDIRLAAYDAGFLKSDKHQKVELKDDQVRITSTDRKTVTIPRYDPAALLTALDAIEEADETADEVFAAPSPAAPALEQAAAPAKPAAPAPAPAPATTAETPAPGAAAPAGAPPAPAAAPPAAAPPVIVYAEPENSFWSDAAVFAGGAVVGGLLGWGLTEALDDDDHDHWDEDDWDNEDVEEALRERREFREERRDDVLAVRNERLDTRQAQSAQRQADRNALRAEREGNRDQQQAARQGQSVERQAARDQSRTERQGGRAEQRAERGGAREARGAESREERAARAREQLNARPEAVGGRTKPVAAESPGPRREQARTERGTRDIKLPSAGTQAGSAQAVRQRGAAGGEARQAGRTAGAQPARITPASQQRASAQAGYAKPSAGQGIAAGASNRREVRAEANRGAQSRGVAPRAAQADRPQRAAPVAAGRGGGGGGTMVAQAPQRINAGGGGGIAADRSRGAAARADADRGRMSRAGGGGGGGGGRRGR